MESRPLLILGSDLAAAALARNLCSQGYRGILVVDAHTEPGGYLGTQFSVGFRFEKLPLLVPERFSGFFEEHGFEMICKEVSIAVAKKGDHISKSMCWRSSGERPWWYPELGGRLCMPRRGWGSAIRSIVSGGCSEYTYYTPRKIDIARRIAVLRNGRVIRYGALVSSYPLPLLLESIYDEKISKAVAELMATIDHVDLLSIALGIRGEAPKWDIVIHGTRASRTHTFYILSNIDPSTSPPNHYLIECLMSYCRGNPPPTDQVSRAFAEARWAKLASDKGSIASERVYTAPYITPLSVDKKLLQEIRSYLESSGVYLAGVGGLWRNLSPWEQVENGIKIAEKILNSPGL